MQLYKISFTSTDKQYIGISSVSAEQRFKTHCNPNNKSVIARAIRKHEGVTLTILAECDDWGELCKMEMAAIAEHNTKSPNGYNCTFGGEGTWGHEVSDEFKQKNSERMKIRLASPEARKELSERAKKYFSSLEPGVHSARQKECLSCPETREKMSKAGKNRFASLEARKELSERAIKQFSSPVARAELAEMTKKRLSSPEAKAAHSAFLKAGFAPPEVRKKMSESAKKYYATLPPGFHSERQKISMSRPEVRQKQSEKIKNYYASLKPGEHSARQKEILSRPEVRAKISASVKKLFSTQESRSVHSARLKIAMSSIDHLNKVNDPLNKIRFRVAVATTWAKRLSRKFSYINQRII